METQIEYTSEISDATVIWLLDHMFEFRFFTYMLKSNGKFYLIEEEFDRRFLSV